MDLNEKIDYLIKKINVDIYEREEVIKLAFLSLLSGESIFLLGLPGVAKSMIARRLKNVLVDQNGFEYLMNRFSSPEEIFGPVSLSKLEEDKYERVINGYLPSADIAFLDEIWKASPAIQNTLLTIINEKIFRNGSNDIIVPLKLLVAASNELPLAGEGLEALYDRFLVRYFVEPIKEQNNFNDLMMGKSNEIKIDDKYKLNKEDLIEIKNNLINVIIGKDVFEFISLFRKEISIKMKEQCPYISDRRWKKIVNMMRVNALISKRKFVSSSDLLVILHTVWETDKQRNTINNIFSDVFNNFISLKTGSSLKEIENNISTSKQLFLKAFIDSKVHRNFTKMNPRGERKLTYFGFEHKQNNQIWWIPMKDGSIVQDDGSNLYFWYSNKLDISYNYNQNQHIGGSALCLNDDGSVLFTEENVTLEPVVDGKIHKDIKKLQEIKIILDNNSLHIANILNKFENEYVKLLNESPGLVHEYKKYIEKANASIKDKINKANSDNNDLLGEVVGKLK